MFRIEKIKTVLDLKVSARGVRFG